MPAAGLAALALAASLAACGGSSSGSEEPEGKYEVKVVKATFPTKQDLGQTSLMRIAVRNTGDRTVPDRRHNDLDRGRGRPDLVAPLRDPRSRSPTWRSRTGRSGSSPKAIPSPPGRRRNAAARPAPAARPTTSAPLKPGKTVEGIWKLSAVKAGRFTVLYQVDAGLGGKAKAETDTGVTPGGTFKVQITPTTPNVEVTDSGEVVEIGKGQGQGKKNSGG